MLIQNPSPPAVQTELHDFEMGDKGKDVGMPLKDFTEEAFEGLCKKGKEGEQVRWSCARLDVKTLLIYVHLGRGPDGEQFWIQNLGARETEDYVEIH